MTGTLGKEGEGLEARDYLSTQKAQCHASSSLAQWRNTAETNLEGNPVALISCLGFAKSLNMPGLLISLLCESV